ncbi:XRE family transcriptional regulator [Streptomyces sp. TRM 70361]|uniref:helix-turn-helix domain-containing protein n=1 Tax=Streptomyces sp. TRM 70361 TaxID=3116553 RepID=UPI002E7B702B|nr:XRE family transcriptional regulator [Streptomyces sp. TRM 70361]MEE1942426.1 XRE family transcriptional regulator [Streptomyces sp. TRM 70361]
METAQSWNEIGERVAEAREAAGLSQGELAKRMRVDRTAVVRMEAGERRITALELFRLAEILKVSPAHLVSRPPAALVSRRTALEPNADASSRERYRLDARLEEHARNAQWLVEHGFLVPPEPDPRVARGAGKVDPLQLARAARSAAGVPSGPLGALADVLERLGLYLTVVDEAAEGASLLLDGYGVAVISGRFPPGRLRWTAAHELGHHLLQDEYHSDAGVAANRDEREQCINRFTGEFLLPEADLRHAWDTGTSDDEAPRSTLIRVAASYRLSWSAIVARARQLNLVDGTTARRLKADTPVKGDFLALCGNEPEPDLAEGTTGAQWRRAALSAWSGGAITASRAVGLLYGAITEEDLPGRGQEDCLP